MINNLRHFPIWRNDQKAIVPLNGLQKDTILILKLNPYYIREAIIKLLDKLGMKEFVKRILGR